MMPATPNTLIPPVSIMIMLTMRNERVSVRPKSICIATIFMPMIQKVNPSSNAPTPAIRAIQVRMRTAVIVKIPFLPLKRRTISLRIPWKKNGGSRQLEGELLRLASPHGHERPDAVKLVREHLDFHLLVALVKRLLGDQSCIDQMRTHLQQADARIGTNIGIGLVIGRKPDRIGAALNLAQT